MKAMRAGLVILSTVVLTGLTAGSAAATSCIAPAAPMETVKGKGDLAMGGKFFEQYDAVVLGEITTIKTQARPMPAGATKIGVEVYGAIGTSAIGKKMVLTADDEGAMNGFPFQRGAFYFVPIKDTGPQGQVNYTFVCDPIGELAGPGEADELLAAARSNGQTVALPGNGAEAEPDAGPAAGESAGTASGVSTGWVVGGGVGAAAAALLAAVFVMRRRRPA